MIYSTIFHIFLLDFTTTMILPSSFAMASLVVLIRRAFWCSRTHAWFYIGDSCDFIIYHTREWIIPRLHPELCWLPRNRFFRGNSLHNAFLIPFLRYADITVIWRFFSSLKHSWIFISCLGWISPLLILLHFNRNSKVCLLINDHLEKSPCLSSCYRHLHASQDSF